MSFNPKAPEYIPPMVSEANIVASQQNSGFSKRKPSVSKNKSSIISQDNEESLIPDQYDRNQGCRSIKGY